MEEKQNPAGFLTVDEAARLIGLSHWTLRSWLSKGVLTKYKSVSRTLVNREELLELTKVRLHPIGSDSTADENEELKFWRNKMHFIFGLIDPQTMRVFHVGCARDPKTQLKTLPALAAKRVAEMAPSTPQMVVFQAVESHPQVAWVKWSKRFRRDLVTSDWKQYEGIANAFTNSKRARRVLGEGDPSDSSAQAEFHKFDQQNPEVFEELLRRARAVKAEGRTRYAIDVLANEIRWEGLDTNRSDGFKIGNCHQPFYARELQMEDPSLCGLFTMGESVADDLVLEDGRSWRKFAEEHADDLRFATSEGEEEEDTQWEY